MPRPAYAAYTQYYKRAIHIVNNMTPPVIAEAPSSVAHTTQGNLTTGDPSHVLHTSDSDTYWGGLDGHMYSGSKKCPNVCMFFTKVDNP